ncbi:8-oxo-dGTP diphosphatase [Streptococcus hillyeri]|uniref:8-oxo-dGTP diphosphatase n=1 Tax=Streptococcus hillyeri TaxID=2282420 RepID=UPI0034E2E402
MPRREQAIITNMCLIEDGQGNLVMQRRDPNRYRWSGWSLPGGHVEHQESLHDAVIREIFEETGLTISQPKLVGVKHWQTQNDERYLVFCYKASHYSGELQSSEEGEVAWISRQELPQLDLAYDMLAMLRLFDEENLSEFYYPPEKENGDWVKRFY